MSMLVLALTLTSALSGPAAAPAAGELLAIRVGRAETIANGTLEHAVILVEGGKIVAVGEDLAIDRGIPILDRPDWVAMPGLVNAYSRMGLTSKGGSDSSPHVTAKLEVYPHDRVYDDLLEAGVTTLALYPPGVGIPGQAFVVRPRGDTLEEMLLADSAYLKIYFRSSTRSKKMIRSGFEDVDSYDEKEEKAREKYDKAVEKAEKAKKKKKKKSKDDDEEDKEDEGKAEKDEELGPYVPPEPDEDVVPFIQLRSGELRALIGISDAGDYLHLLDAIGEEDFAWDLRLPVTRTLNIYEVAEELGELECRIVMEPSMSLVSGTMRQRNLPAELSEAGAKLVFIPRRDTLTDHRDWLRDVGTLVATGVDRQTALRAVTLEPAELLGLGERLGSLEVGKDANLLFMNGDPLEVGSRIEAVMLEGEFVFGPQSEAGQ